MYHAWKAKISVFLVLLFAVNLLVVIALEILLFCPALIPLTAGALAEFDSRYEGCTNAHTTTTIYMVIAAVLEGLELALFQLIRREDRLKGDNHGRSKPALA